MNSYDGYHVADAQVRRIHLGPVLPTFQSQGLSLRPRFKIERQHRAASD
jgi:hypothetical protein